ncbi:GltB/FmdC/FwdC-like GXGXG domain-containing protein [Heliobacterium mobile]|uniref:GltB/FmdC/FwdC-like GXGXG domain-containing protein n=1 Tax=Heliobacterium mobile TaxID=28064 RepID=UPI002E255D8D
MSRRIDAQGLYYKELNQLVRQAFSEGVTEVVLDNVNGQRYLGDGISSDGSIIIHGTPGNDMAAYMNGLQIVVRGNAQDATGNTMNEGTIVVHGDAGDTVGYAMRGGEIFIKGSVGYRVGIHMKEYLKKNPVIVVGGKAGAFFGEYMAGGILILLGLSGREGYPIVGDYCGTGMHGGVMYIRGQVEEYKLGKEVKIVDMTAEDESVLERYVSRYADYFGCDKEAILAQPFSKLIPFNKRPYGNLYTGV